MKIAITDNHLLILSHLENIILTSGYMELCGKYMSGHALTEGLKASVPDILLLDYHLPDKNGAQLARYITYHYPQIKILALTGFDKPDLASEMLKSGCKGYLMKATADAPLILEAINRVYDGYLFIDNSVSDLYTSSIRTDRLLEDNSPKLTNRELEVLQCIGDELSNQEIADKLYISKKTVENHRHSIMIKSGAKNTAGLIKFAIELKLI